jgi:hypothetical protein
MTDQTGDPFGLPLDEQWDPDPPDDEKDDPEAVLSRLRASVLAVGPGWTNLTPRALSPDPSHSGPATSFEICQIEGFGEPSRSGHILPTPAYAMTTALTLPDRRAAAPQATSGASRPSDAET